MCKTISSDVVIGNCIIETVKRDRTQISFDQLIAFDDQIDKPLEKIDYFTKFSINKVFEFEGNYPFFVSTAEGVLTIKLGSNKNQTIERLTRCFRMGLPNSVISTFTSASDKIFGIAK